MKTIKIGFLIFLFQGCNYSQPKDSASLSGGQGSFSSDSLITFDLIKNGTLQNCQACHSGSQAPDLSTFATTAQQIQRIIIRTNDNSMPPANMGYTSLSACQKALLQKWMDLGTPETSTVNVGSVAECQGANLGEPINLIPIAQLPLNYNNLLTRILQPKCTMCHSPTGNMPDLQFYPYSTLMLKSSKWAAPGKSSTVYKECANQTMPPKNSGISPLTTDELSYVERWINAGKPEL